MNKQAPPVTYQTVKLSRGKHDTPRDGACVMELASMLAREPFNDHPRSVCPVIGAFLRAYNDTIDDDRRQDLYRLAALVIGTRGSEALQRRRIDRCLQWGREMRRTGSWPRRLLAPILVAEGPTPPEAAGSFAARAITRHNDRTHAQALELIEELAAMTSPPSPALDIGAGPPAAAVSGRHRQHA
jgi:hypothetical protein